MRCSRCGRKSAEVVAVARPKAAACRRMRTKTKSRKRFPTSELPKVDKSIGFYLQQVGPGQALHLNLLVLELLIALR
jgi:hypothetical protein